MNWRPDVRAVAERIRPVIERVENIRQMALAKRTKAIRVGMIIGGCGLGIGLLVLAAGNGSPAGLVIALLGVVAGIIAYFAIEGGATKAYRAIHKREVFAKAAQEVLPGISYLPESMVPRGQFVAGGLFSSRIDRYNGEDYFTGRAGATDLLFSELHVERKETSTDSEGRTTTRWVTVFKGIYLVADFHKEFRCRVKIVPDVAEANFGWLGRKLQGFTGNLIRLENPEFERAFKVTSEDDIGAHYLLTPDMQERFLDLRKRWSEGIHAALLDSCLHLAIPLQGDWFEGEKGMPAGATAPLENFLQQLVSVLHITETLDLNTRIWTKQ